MDYIPSKRKQDVVDAVPTRSGIKKAFQDQSNVYCSLEEFSTDLNENTENNKLECCNIISKCSEKNFRDSIWKVFCTLCTWNYLLERYSIISLFLNIGAVTLYIFDFVTDWLNAFNAYFFRIEEKGQDYLFYFWLTVAVITVPSLVMQIMSFWWEREDNRDKKRINGKPSQGIFYYSWLVLFHCFQIAPVYRYGWVMYYGLMSRYKEVCKKEDEWKFYDDKYKGQLADVSFVRMLESFLESAPQVILQVYLMIKTTDVLPITVVSVCVSLFGMSSSFVSYQRALRDTLDDKKQLSILACIFLFLCRSFIYCSRILALALLLNTSVWAWILSLIAHWAIMSGFVYSGKTNFCNSNLKEILYDITIGFCYIFSYIHVHADSYNSYRILGYYSLIFIQNSFIAVAWYHFRSSGSLMSDLIGYGEIVSLPTEPTVVISSKVALGLMLTVICSFILGMLFLVIFYLCLHPKSSLRVCKAHVEKQNSTIICTTHIISTDSFSKERSSETKYMQQNSRFPLTSIRKLYILNNSFNNPRFDKNFIF